MLMGSGARVLQQVQGESLADERHRDDVRVLDLVELRLQRRGERRIAHPPARHAERLGQREDVSPRGGRAESRPEVLFQ